MSLSDDLIALEAWVAVCADGTFELTHHGLAEMQVILGRCAEMAVELEGTLEHTAEQLSPRRDRAAVAAAIASGKVTLLAAHRVRQLPDLRFGEDGGVA